MNNFWIKMYDSCPLFPQIIGYCHPGGSPVLQGNEVLFPIKMKITKVNKDDCLPGDDNDPVYTHPRETKENSFCMQMKLSQCRIQIG